MPPFQAPCHLRALPTGLGRVAVLAAACWLGLACAAPSAAQAPRRPEPARAERPLAPRADAPALAPEAARARVLLLRYLREGLRRPFVAHETTRLLQGQVRESQQIVKQAGLGAMRVEYQSPPAMRGEVLLILGRRMLRYVPAEGVVHESRAPETGVLGRAGALVEGLRSGAVRARVVGREEVAGRNAAIVEVRGAGREGFFKRLWIDTQSGVRMKIEDVDPSGVVVSTSYFTRIDLDPVLDAGEFRPGSLSRREARPRPLRTRPLASVAEAQQRVGYAIREPSLPPGYRLVGVWVAPAPVGRQAVILRYTDGVSTFTLSQHPAPARWGSRGADQAPRPRDDRGAIRWVSGGRVFILVGNLSPHAVDRIIASLR